MGYTFMAPAKILSGKNVIEELGEVARSEKVQKVYREVMKPNYDAARKY